MASIKISDVTPDNIRNFVSGNYNFYVSNYNKPDKIHQLEQFMYRAYLCRDCLENGKCKHCGCTTPNLFFAPRKMDSENKWPPFFFDMEGWDEYKQRHRQAMEFTTLFRKKLDDYRDGLPNNAIPQLVKDIADLLDAHRAEDEKLPAIPLEQTEFYKGLDDRHPDLPSQHTEVTGSDTLGRTVLV